MSADLTDCGRDHITALGLFVFQDTVLDMCQGVANHLGGDGSGLQGHTVLQMSDTQQGHEGQRQVGANTFRRPVIDGADFEVVFAHPEGVLHLPQAAVLAQDGGGVG